VGPGGGGGREKKVGGHELKGTAAHLSVPNVLSEFHHLVQGLWPPHGSITGARNLQLHHHLQLLINLHSATSQFPTVLQSSTNAPSQAHYHYHYHQTLYLQL
jgi:hypothetical protein